MRDVVRATDRSGDGPARKRQKGRRGEDAAICRRRDPQQNAATDRRSRQREQMKSELEATTETGKAPALGSCKSCFSRIGENTSETYPRSLRAWARLHVPWCSQAL